MEELKEYTVSNIETFPKINFELRAEAQMLVEREKLCFPEKKDAKGDIPAQPGIPQPQDAESIFEFKMVDENDKEVNTVQITALLESALKTGDINEISKIKFKQDQFVSVEIISSILNRVLAFIEEAKHTIESIQQQLFNLPKDSPILVDTLQRLKIYEIHLRNLEQTQTTLQMYALIAEAKTQDSDDKRIAAEKKSFELYGEISKDDFLLILHRHLSSLSNANNSSNKVVKADGREVDEFVAKSTAVNDLIEDLYQELLRDNWDMKHLDWQEIGRVEDQVEMQTNELNFEKRQLKRSRLVSFLTIAKKHSSDQTNLINKIKELKANSIDGSAIEKAFLDVMKKNVDKVNQLYLQNLNPYEDIEFIEQVKNILVTKNQNYTKLFEDLSEFKLNEIIELFNLSKEEFEEIESKQVTIDSVTEDEKLFNSRLTPIQMAKFFQNQLQTMGVDSEILFAGDNPKKSKDTIKIVFSNKSTTVSASAATNTLTLPLIPNAITYSGKRAAELFAHEIMVHLLSPYRVKEIAPTLGMVMGSSPANEGCAVTLEAVMDAVVDNPELAVVNVLTDTNDVFVTEMERRYSSDTLKVKLKNGEKEGSDMPVDSGKHHMLAMGLFLGLDRNGKRRTPLEVFNIMYRIYLAEYKQKYTEGNKAHEEALKSAWTTGVQRQVRGLVNNLTHVTSITTKNNPYFEGANIISDMLKDGKNIGNLIIGKVRPENLQDQKILGVTKEKSDEPINKIVRSDIANSLQKALNI